MLRAGRVTYENKEFEIKVFYYFVVFLYLKLLKAYFSHLYGQDIMVGEEAQAARSFLEIVYPMECGKIKYWDEMELLWDYSFKRLQLDPPNTKILLTEPPMNPMQNRQRMLQVLIMLVFLCIHSCNI